MQHQQLFRECMESLDVAKTRELWKHIAPHLPQPGDDLQALKALHMARTAANSMPLKARAYSHRWLLDWGHPSLLPDNLRPRAERMYPVGTRAVGVSVNASNPEFRPAAEYIEARISQRIGEMFADGRTEPAYVSTQMRDARNQARKEIFGRVAIDIAPLKVNLPAKAN